MKTLVFADILISEVDMIKILHFEDDFQIYNIVKDTVEIALKDLEERLGILTQRKLLKLVIELNELFV
jgi:hypothetical protein